MKIQLHSKRNPKNPKTFMLDWAKVSVVSKSKYVKYPTREELVMKIANKNQVSIKHIEDKYSHLIDNRLQELLDANVRIELARYLWIDTSPRTSLIYNDWAYDHLPHEYSFNTASHRALRGDNGTIVIYVGNRDYGRDIDYLIDKRAVEIGKFDVEYMDIHGNITKKTLLVKDGKPEDFNKYRNLLMNLQWKAGYGQDDNGNPYAKTYKGYSADHYHTMYHQLCGHNNNNRLDTDLVKILKKMYEEENNPLHDVWV